MEVLNNYVTFFIEYLTFWNIDMLETDIKSEAHAIIDKLPQNASWDDLMYEIYVRQAIEAGLKDSDAGRTIAVAEVRAKFGLPK